MSNENKEKPTSTNPLRQSFSEARATADKSEVALREEKILEFWKENKIFEKSLEKPSPKGDFVFYDGPPFATGLPHHGHILSTTMKDVIPRYKTMKGYKVERIWGWDCHGLPIENIIEEELGLETKKDIETYGIEKFNQAAQDSVLRYEKEWKEIIPRVGRWVDMDRDYKTMDWTYTESIWWAFKTLFDKGYVYEGHKAMHLCPRCETTLSNFEVNQGYKDVTDISVFVKFELTDPIRTSGSQKEPTSNGAGEPKTFLLAWTTTPWTLPGNAALAIGKDFEYVKIKIGNENFILAKNLLNVIEEEYTVIGEVKTEDLIGKSYTPLFDYYSTQSDLENRENGWKVYAADFVTVEDGTGIVHIAPAFGDDDMTLGKKEKLPFIQHVTTGGVFKDEVKDFIGQSVKPKDEPQSADIEIIKFLAHSNKLFAKKKIVHSYPHCWRCETPLLNYASSSWFIRVTDLVDKLLANNKKTNWIPEHIRDGRFGKWLEGARDWAISRSRFWGAPFPVWQCDSCETQTVIGGIEDLQAHLPQSNNTYTVMRHGGAESNRDGIVSSKIENQTSLTEEGKKEVHASALRLKNNPPDGGIDIIISSPFLRAKQTAEIVAEQLGISSDDIVYDDRIKEIDTGVFNMKNIEEYRSHFSSTREKITKRPEGGENLLDVKKRVMDFLYELNEKEHDKNILIICHEYPVWMMEAGSKGLNKDQTAEIKEGRDDFIRTSEFRELPFAVLPHDQHYELDLHRPYIDNVHLSCSCGGTMNRIDAVFDCWFESGSMPYASLHYPFENKERFHKRFPSDFIAEGLDQTRGWFYNLLVLSTALFDDTAFKNVVVNGLILAEDGRKMSKRLKNYPDLRVVVDKYGADALRLFLMNSPAVRGEEVGLSEKNIQEVLNKVMNRLWNVLSFYEMYADTVSSEKMTVSENILDVWILARLNETIKEIEKGLDNYEFDKASRPIEDFVDDLSTWYIRRSRDRYKGDDEKDKASALMVTQFVLKEFSKAIAPTIPFISEAIFQRVKGPECSESVHLEKWPQTTGSSALGKIFSFLTKNKEDKVLTHMRRVREIVSLGLEARQKAGIKVRQPLQQLVVKGVALSDQYIDLIKDEVNIKEVEFSSTIEEEVQLVTAITPALKKEGDFRELLRGIQDARKKEGLNTNDVIVLTVDVDEKGKELVETNKEELKKSVQAKDIAYGSVSDGYEIPIDDHVYKISIKK
ncbi:isoleucine--tRNA ligase [Candidatus Wolfebacteria bacterium]|nr:MAG: isoleucine--tRNA ligase [Candidatus Wolfebacteria bacterium]